MKKPVEIVLVGIGGYGHTYVDKLLNDEKKLNAIIVGVVDPIAEKSEGYQRIVERKIPVFSTLEEFYEKRGAELAILSTPIHLHAPQTITALENGSNVLCEKPMCASLDEVEAIIRARDKVQKFVAIGFNWSFSPSVQKLKEDILKGEFGQPLRLKTIVNWPRDKAYYNRNQWAGRLLGENDEPIFDSVANNATAHYLHHMLYLLGTDLDESVQLKEVTAELYRANPIESFDTCAVKIKTEGDVDVHYYATHAVNDVINPTFFFEFEKATIVREKRNQEMIFVAKFRDGTEKDYGNPDHDHLQKLETCLQAVRSGTREILCGPEAARSHVEAIMAMHQSVPEIVEFPKDIIQIDEDTEVTWVSGLSETLKQCYEQWSIPSELGVTWAKRGKRILIHTN